MTCGHACCARSIPKSREIATLGAKRDAGFSIFYMGINMGAIMGPFICGTVGEKINYHWGFSIAGFGMLIGLIQYRMGSKYLGTAGLRTTVTTRRPRRLCRASSTPSQQRSWPWWAY